jgi:hypothetical protein
VTAPRTITEAQATNRCLTCGAPATWVSRGDAGGIAVPYCEEHGNGHGEEVEDG